MQSAATKIAVLASLETTIGASDTDFDLVSVLWYSAIEFQKLSIIL